MKSNLRLASKCSRFIFTEIVAFCVGGGTYMMVLGCFNGYINVFTSDF